MEGEGIPKINLGARRGGGQKKKILKAFIQFTNTKRIKVDNNRARISPDFGRRKVISAMEGDGRKCGTPLSGAKHLGGQRIRRKRRPKNHKPKNIRR